MGYVQGCRGSGDSHPMGMGMRMKCMLCMLAVRIDYHFRSIIYLLLKLYYSFELKLSHNHDSVDSIFRNKL